MDNYYDYEPLAHLSRHLILAGWVAEETRRVGFQLAARTGLGVQDVDRVVEHHAGMSRWELVATEGEASYREAESDVLASLVGARPPCIITLSDGTLLDEGNRDLATANGDLVLLDRDLGHCFWRLQRGAAESSAGWHPTARAPLTELDQVRGYFETRRKSFQGIDDRIDLRGRSLAAVVDELVVRLDEVE